MTEGIAESVTPRGRYESLLWLFGGCLAFLFALYPMSATLVGSTYLPADADSFYHAHRILDSIADPAHMYQFDSRIHAPEGSWITWPWAYDMMQAAIGHVAVYGFGVAQPLSVLAYIAPLWTFLNAALILGIANRLGLTFSLKVVAMLCFACSPLTQALHRVGMLDHHFVEYSFVLASVLLGLAWFQKFQNRHRATALGLVLGVAPAFHCGLFILQIPILVTLGIRWLLDRPREPEATTAFAASLISSTFIFLLPSEPFRMGIFEFWMQSWFHLYVAACTALMACLMARLDRSKWSAFVLIAVSVVLMALIYRQTARAGNFLAGHMVDLSAIGEVKGVFGYLAEHNFNFLTTNYSGLIWLIPVSLILLFWRLRSVRDDASIYFALSALFGTVLLLLEYRFENYGSFALYFPLCLFANDGCRRWPAAASRITVGVALLAAALYAPALPRLSGTVPVGGNLDYEMTRSIYAALAQACDRHPGLVLADSSDGHYITYHTKCSVIADDFIITRQQEEKLLQVDRLLNSSLDEVLAQLPDLRFIYVRRNDNVFEMNCADAPCAKNKGLRQQLLFDSPPYPRALRPIGEVRFQRSKNQSEPLARAFEVTGPATEQTPTQPVRLASDYPSR